MQNKKMTSRRFPSTTLLAAGLVAVLMVGGQAMANPPAESVAAVKAAHPDAVARYALQISDADPAKRNMVLKVAEHLIKNYGKDKVDIEIVAFGPGIKLLFAHDNPHTKLIAKLAEDGVRFSACNNALKHMTKVLGHEPELVPAARIVPAGIVRVHDLAVDGYFTDKP